MSLKEHRKQAPQRLNIMVITVSDSRDEQSDKSGQLIMRLLADQGHQISLYRIVPDQPTAINEAIFTGLETDGVEVILLNGGTGIAKRDTTYETVSSLLEKEMPGFGEIFRYLSYVEDIGSAAILSRAVAGIRAGKAIFAMPGSTGAVKLAMQKIILPEMGHVVSELRKDLGK